MDTQLCGWLHCSAPAPPTLCWNIEDFKKKPSNIHFFFLLFEDWIFVIWETMTGRTLMTDN